MSQLQDMLRDADPVGREASVAEQHRAQVRRAVLAAPVDAVPAPPARARISSALWIAIASIVLAFATFRPDLDTRSATLHAAAVRFEVRLAETQAGDGLREVRIGDRTIYLHQDAIVTNDDILRSRVVPGNDASHFNVAVTLTAAGGDKMRQATSQHIGRPVAFLLDGEVIMAPVVRAPIGTEGMLTGDFSKAEADRVAAGMMVR